MKSSLEEVNVDDCGKATVDIGADYKGEAPTVSVKEVQLLVRVFRFGPVSNLVIYG